MTIKIFITGGTFDKEYNELTGELFFRDTNLPEMLELGRAKLDVDIETLMMVDSLTMTADNREKLAEKCSNAKEEQILITHGTDTIVETAKLLKEKVKNKVVVLTGAMIPYKFGSSDGMFNLGSSIAFVQSLKQGVYICMNGKVFDPDNCQKNREIGEFEVLT